MSLSSPAQSCGIVDALEADPGCETFERIIARGYPKLAVCLHGADLIECLGLDVAGKDRRFRDFHADLARGPSSGAEIEGRVAAVFQAKARRFGTYGTLMERTMEAGSTLFGPGKAKWRDRLRGCKDLSYFFLLHFLAGNRIHRRRNDQLNCWHHSYLMKRGLGEVGIESDIHFGAVLKTQRRKTPAASHLFLTIDDPDSKDQLIVEPTAHANPTERPLCQRDRSSLREKLLRGEPVLMRSGFIYLQSAGVTLQGNQQEEHMRSRLDGLRAKHRSACLDDPDLFEEVDKRFVEEPLLTVAPDYGTAALYLSGKGVVS